MTGSIFIELSIIIIIAVVISLIIGSLYRY